MRAPQISATPSAAVARNEARESPARERNARLCKIADATRASTAASASAESSPSVWARRMRFSNARSNNFRPCANLVRTASSTFDSTTAVPAARRQRADKAKARRRRLAATPAPRGCPRVTQRASPALRLRRIAERIVRIVRTRPSACTIITFCTVSHINIGTPDFCPLWYKNPLSMRITIATCSVRMWPKHWPKKRRCIVKNRRFNNEPREV